MTYEKKAEKPSSEILQTLLIEINERCLQRSLTVGERDPSAPPIDTYVEQDDGNGKRIVATPEYRAWFVRTYCAERDEVSVPKASPVPKAQEHGAGRRGRPNAVLLDEF